MRPEFIDFNGARYRLSGNYYRRNAWDSHGPTNLHRAVWSFHHGPIPAGHDIHHLDGDPFNNDLANLALMERSEHRRGHTLERIASGDLLPPSDHALQRAAEWHRSPDGLQWHSEHGKRTWAHRAPKLCQCGHCGQQFESIKTAGAKWCSQRCKLDARTKANGGIPRAEREPVRCVCQECGQSFLSVAVTPALYCHQNCKAQAYRRRQGKTVGVRPYRQKARLLPSERVACQ